MHVDAWQFLLNVASKTDCCTFSLFWRHRLVLALLLFLSFFFISFPTIFGIFVELLFTLLHTMMKPFLLISQNVTLTIHYTQVNFNFFITFVIHYTSIIVIFWILLLSTMLKSILIFLVFGSLIEALFHIFFLCLLLNFRCFIDCTLCVTVV